MRYKIVVPKNIEAMQKLECGEIVIKDCLQLLLRHEDVVALWDSSFMHTINVLVDVNIDYAEEESIVDLDKMERVLNSGVFEIIFRNEELNRILASIKEFFLAAKNYKTGIYFFF